VKTTKGSCPDESEKYTTIRIESSGAERCGCGKKTTKVRVVASMSNDTVSSLPNWSLSYYLSSVSRRKGTLFDDVLWGQGKDMPALRLVGVAHTSTNIRWYRTTVPRYALSARQPVQAYRLRWLLELLFRELKQKADIARAFTGDANAVQALTHGAMLAYVLVRSIRIQAALVHEIPLEQLRPLACLEIARAVAREIWSCVLGPAVCKRLLRIVADSFGMLAREVRPSRSRPRIALKFRAVGAQAIGFRQIEPGRGRNSPLHTVDLMTIVSRLQ
jgi:hypothetical protein